MRKRKVQKRHENHLETLNPDIQAITFLRARPHLGFAIAGITLVGTMLHNLGRRKSRKT